MAGQIFGYVRVSGTDQNPVRQVESIGEVEESFTDRGGGGRRAARTAVAYDVL